MAWYLLIAAGLFGVAWAVGLKYTHGFTRLWPSIGTGAAMAVGTAVLGMILFNEPRSLPRVVCILLIVAGIAGLKFFAKG